MTPHKETLVVVFDGSKARFLRLSPDGKLFSQEEMESGLHRFAREAVSDKPGRSVSSGGAGKSAIEPKHDEHKMEKHNFVHAIVQHLETAHNQHVFERLIVVAPERSIGEFRRLAPESLKKIVSHEIKKELMHLPTAELEERVAQELKAGVR